MNDVTKGKLNGIIEILFFILKIEMPPIPSEIMDCLHSYKD